MGVSLIEKLAAMVTLATISLFGVALAGAPAQADDDPYTAGVRTSCNVDVPTSVKRGTSPTVRVDVQPNGPSQGARPQGEVEVSITKDGTGIYNKTVDYDGHPVEVQGPTLHELGRYEVKAQFKTADGSVFKSCSGSAAFDVRAGQAPNTDGPDPDPGDHEPDGLLPDTGGPDLRLLLLGLALVVSGLGLVIAGRERRPSSYLV